MKTFVDNAEKRRFELIIDGYTAYVSYEMVNPQLANLTHTEVPVPLRSRGVGGELIQLVLDELEKRGCQVLPTCSFIDNYIRKYSYKPHLLAENINYFN